MKDDKIERISWKQVKRDMFFAKVKNVCKDTKDKAVDLFMWAWDHKIEIGAGVTTAIGVAAEGRRIYDRIHSRYEDYQSEREIYDPSLHKTLRLKKKLSNRQKRELQERYDSGEKIHDIIVDMGIIK